MDRNIRHIPCFNGYDSPQHVQWKRDGVRRKVHVYTAHYLTMPKPDKHSIQVAWIIEPSVINSKAYNILHRQKRNYDYIISHDIKFLETFSEEKRVFCPGSGSSLYSHEWKIYPKSKLVLTVVGDKRKAIGHQFRHDVVKALGSKLKVRGRGYIPFFPEARAEVYAPFMYQVCIHNTLVADYWSDILIDCFATGTVPIVWGSKYLHKYFDTDGIIFFDTIEELDGILQQISEDGYHLRMPAIKKNFETAFHEYKVVEDYLYNNFFKQFDESPAYIS